MIGLYDFKIINEKMFQLMGIGENGVVGVLAQRLVD
jgi:hypothetical protein